MTSHDDAASIHWTKATQQYSDQEIISILRAGKPQITPKSTCLFHVVAFERPAVLEYLLRKEHDDPNVLNRDGETPLASLLVESSKNYAAMKLLIKHGAKVNCMECVPRRSDIEINTLVFLALEDPIALKLLLQAGANPNVPNTAGILPIQRAIRNANSDSLTLLKAYGAKQQYCQKDLELVCRNYWGAIKLLEGGHWIVHGECWALLARLSRWRQPSREVFELLWLAGYDLRPVHNVFANASRSVVPAEMHKMSALDVLTGLVSPVMPAWAQTDIRCMKKELVLHRMIELCFGLQSLRLPALMTYELWLAMTGGAWVNISMHYVWRIITTVKHFHDQPAEQAVKKRRL